MPQNTKERQERNRSDTYVFHSFATDVFYHSQGPPLAGDRIRRGNTIVIFPEEGRTRERTMRPFQRGAFLLAIKTGLPILPIAIDGTYDVMRVGAKHVTPGRVTVKAGTPIATEGISVREKEKLADEARAQIERMLFV